MALGTGSAMAHTAINSVFGSRHPDPVEVQQVRLVCSWLMLLCWRAILAVRFGQLLVFPADLPWKPNRSLRKGKPEAGACDGCDSRLPWPAGCRHCGPHIR